MNPIILSIIVLIVAGAVVDIFKVCANTVLQRRNLKSGNELLKTQIVLLNKIIEEQRQELYSYKYFRVKNSDNNFYDSDVKEAVKYAMKKAHPDNGGSSEEFNKFRELYNKIK